MRIYDRLDIIVADVCCISPDFLHTKCRKTRAINARYILIKMKYDYGLSISELANEFNRSLVHIYYILRCVDRYIAVDIEFSELFNKVRKRYNTTLIPYSPSLISIGCVVVIRGNHLAHNLQGVVTSLHKTFFTVESYHNPMFKETYVLTSGKHHPLQSPDLDIISIEI